MFNKLFKFFLNLSKDEQRDRLIRRLDKKNKNWKFSPDDLKERELWDEYQDCYEYHGGTTIELRRRIGELVVKQDWLLFDSVEDAQAYFNETGGMQGGSYA